jgi:electron transfer flavoprotein alpha subunit
MRALLLTWDLESAARLAGVVPAEASLTVLAPGQPAEVADALRELPADTLLACPALEPALEPGALAGALERLLLERADVLVLDSSQASRDLAGWLAGSLGAPVVWAIDALRATETGEVEADRILLDGSWRAVHALALEGPPAVVLARPGAAGARAGAAAPAATTLELDLPAPLVLRSPLEQAGEVSLAGARAVLSVGRGVGSPERMELFAALASRSGAALGATRAVVDAGWLPFAHQIGQTGASVAPEVYVGFGVSGAIQHLAGIRASRTIVAVNTDKRAPLCGVADLVVEADATAVAQALLDLAAAHVNGGSNE